jgi:TolA-binding protein
MKESDRLKLIRILGMLGSNHPGERAAAAIAAHRQIRVMGTSWGEVLSAPKVLRGETIVRTVYEYGIDHVRAAEARMRQLRGEIERLKQENARLKNRLAVRADQERRARAAASDLSRPTLSSAHDRR